MKKILAILAAPLIALTLATPAHADFENKGFVKSDTCGGGDKVIQTLNWQRRYDDGTPQQPADDEIGFDLGSTDELRIDFEQGRNAVDKVLVKINRTVFGNPDTVYTKTINYSSGAPQMEIVQILYDNHLSVSTEPRVKTIVEYNGGAECSTKSAWNDSWGS